MASIETLDDDYVLESFPDGFDSYPYEPRGTTEISSGIDRYRWLSKLLLAEHTGSPDTYLSIEEQQELAKVIQATNAALKGIEELEGTDPEAAAEARRQFSHLIDEGKKAEHKLVETHLQFAAYYARASMNILPPKRTGKAGNKQTQSDGIGAPPENDAPAQFRDLDKDYIGAYTDITKLSSRYADLEDRTQVATAALVIAAHLFKPTVIGKNGKPASFIAFAKYHVHAALDQYSKTRELPGWHVPLHVVETIYNSQRHPDEYTPEELEKLHWYDEGRRSESLEAVQYFGVADEETGDPSYLPDELELADVLPDTNESLGDEIVYLGLAHAINKVFTDPDNGLNVREDGIMRLRFGISDDPKLYGQQVTLEETGKVFGIKKERVRQIESKTLSKLRRPVRSEPLSPFLDDEPAMDMGEYYLPARVDGTTNLRTMPTIARRVVGEEVQITCDDQEEEIILAGLDTLEDDEPWDMQEADRLLAEQATLEYEQVAQKFANLLRYAAPYTFQKSFAEEMGTEYPVGLVDIINDTLGSNLTVGHIEEYWNEHLQSFVDSIFKEHDNDFCLDRVSALFAKLLAERMQDDSQVILRIPENLNGKLDYLGAWMRTGELVVEGDAGDSVGHDMGGVASIRVNGSVHDFAGAFASGYAVLEVSGNAGHFLAGQARQSAHIIVHGYAGDWCGEAISGSEIVVEVDGNAGVEVGSNARNGTITVGGGATSIAEPQSNKVHVTVNGKRYIAD